MPDPNDPRRPQFDPRAPQTVPRMPMNGPPDDPNVPEPLRDRVMRVPHVLSNPYDYSDEDLQTAIEAGKTSTADPALRRLANQRQAAWAAVEAAKKGDPALIYRAMDLMNETKRMADSYNDAPGKAPTEPPPGMPSEIARLQGFAAPSAPGTIAISPAQAAQLRAASLEQAAQARVAGAEGRAAVSDAVARTAAHQAEWKAAEADTIAARADRAADRAEARARRAAGPPRPAAQPTVSDAEAVAEAAEDVAEAAAEVAKAAEEVAQPAPVRPPRQPRQPRT